MSIAVKKSLLPALCICAIPAAVLIAASDDWNTTEGVGTDLAAEARCLECHGSIKAAWENLSSHKVVLGCTVCHSISAASGKGHAATKACAGCHSEKAHPEGAACAACHDPHGTANAFLFRGTIETPGRKSAEVVLLKPEGASANGLTRAGVEGQKAGSGACEVCHESTTYYNSAGTGAAHSPEWCGRCHDHQEGFKAE